MTFSTPSDDQRLKHVVHELRALGVHVTPDNRVVANGAAKLIGVSQKTLRNWRSTGEGPPWTRAGQVWYRVPAVLEWLDAQERSCNSMP